MNYLTCTIACAYPVLFTINNISLCFKSPEFGRFQEMFSVIKILKRHLLCAVEVTDTVFYVHGCWA